MNCLVCNRQVRPTDRPNADAVDPAKAPGPDVVHHADDAEYAAEAVARPLLPATVAPAANYAAVIEASRRMQKHAECD